MSLLRLPWKRGQTAGPLLFAAMLGASCSLENDAQVDVSAENDRGVALMGRYEYGAAATAFESVASRRPDWLDGRVNLAIATLNRQQEDDEQRALAILAEVLEQDPRHLRALYTKAILELYLGRAEQSAALFERVAAADPDDAYAAYFLGQSLLQMGKYARASEWFLKSIDIEPYLRSAYWAGGQALRRTGRVDESKRLLAEYDRFESNPAVRLAGFSYLRMGPKAEALVSIQTTVPKPPAATGPLFASAVAVAPSDRVGGTISTADVNADGRQDLVVARPTSPLVMAGANGTEFLELGNHPLGDVGPALAMSWGDIDDDGLVDVIVCGTDGVRLWQQPSAGEWTGSDAIGDHRCRAVAVFDADHDGDLDIFVAGADGNELFSNDRDGSFSRLAAGSGLLGGAGRQIVVADLDSDRDLDILVVNDTPPHDVWRNDRLWSYEPMPGMEDLIAADLRAVTAIDADADGRREIFGVASNGSLVRWRNDVGTWHPELIVVGAPTEFASLDAADFDGDGRLELLRSAAGAFEIIDPRSRSITLRQRVDGLTKALAVVTDPGRGPAVVTGGRDGITIWPPGPGRHGFLTLSPTGRSEANQMRSNASGIGTKVHVRAAGRWTVLDRLDTHSGPGQSLQPLAVGLGGHHQADFVELEWPDGVSQTELELAAGAHHDIAEIQRQLASCPVLFAWNGEAFEFVSDVLGGAALGYLDAPGRYAPPRPVEGFLLDTSMLAARHGRYALKLGEPMEENVYLDSARLTVYDVPEGWDIVLDERLGVNGAPPTGRAITFRDARLPTRAIDAVGLEVTDLVRQQDRRAPEPGDLDHRFIGLLAEPQVLTLEFDAALDAGGAVLVADGWIEYPYSQTVFAAWQAGLRYQPPTLEARAGDGDWQAVAVEFGYPAGMPRTMALPLPDLPPGTTALRLSSNMEIYWDRLRVVREEPLNGIVTATLAPLEARIARSGFAKRTTGPQRLPHYDYAQRSTYWDAKAPAGFYTAFGDGGELVREIDGALAVITSGEEIHLEFEAQPGPPAGHRRLFRIMFHGWAKDMDLYTLDGDTVGPLPLPEDADATMLAERDRLHARYNVRFREGL